jgi:molybdopterin-guanine dinucleotide biosynthesis protein A
MSAILLLGGRSTRMGAAKASLDWHGVPLAAHVAAVLQQATAGPIIAVAAPEQAIPPLPAGIEVTRDRVPGEGPLRGVEAGLLALGDRADATFVASVDTPLLHPALVTALLGAFGPDDDLLVPDAQGFRHPLTAVWRTSTLAIVTAALAEGVAGPGYLFDRVRTRFLDESALLSLPGVAEADPHLDSLRNANTPEELASVRERAHPR